VFFSFFDPLTLRPFVLKSFLGYNFPNRAAELLASAIRLALSDSGIGASPERTAALWPGNRG